uniref:Uncharacterized protein n=1 Tax=Anguilla anguilla TaxID=7936 RepID=A0A0E9TWN5_ANGAN
MFHEFHSEKLTSRKIFSCSIH